MYPVYKNVKLWLSRWSNCTLTCKQQTNTMRMLGFFSTNIALVKMYTPLCGSECEFSNGVVFGNIEQVSCVALQRLYCVVQCFWIHRVWTWATSSKLHGKDGIVKMGTGAGKSLCMFMVPLAYSDTHHQPTKCTDGRSGSSKIPCT